jgi:hypothetical protein
MILRNVGTHIQDCTQPGRPQSELQYLLILGCAGGCLLMLIQLLDFRIVCGLAATLPVWRRKRRMVACLEGLRKSAETLNQDSIRPRFEPRTSRMEV